MRFRKLLLAILLALLPAYGAAAVTIATLDLSDRSSEDSSWTCGSTCTGIPTADELDATLTFTVADNGTDVTLTLSNDTDEEPAGTFDIDAVYFNTSGVQLTGVSLNGWSMSQDHSINTGPGSDTHKADGFGYFDIVLAAGTPLAAGSSLNFTFSAASATTATDFTTDLSRDTPTPAMLLSYGAAWFTSGPQVTCPGGNNICDSGFGAAIPEPSTAILLTAGLLGLLGTARRIGNRRS
jgi:hypothetical protein